MYIVGFWPDYEDYSFQDIVMKGYNVKVINPQEKLSKKPFFKHLPRSFKNKRYKKSLSTLVKEQPDAIYIFQEFRIFIEFLLEMPSILKASIILRKPVFADNRTPDYINKLKEKNYHLWSFDKKDCADYQLNYYHQFIKAYPNIEKTPILYDFAFTGTDKGRADDLYNLQKDLLEYDLRTSLNIVKDHKDYLISYEDYLQQLCQANCIIDFMQKGQTGMTLRPFEAYLYKRKLITNNEDIKLEQIYHPNNIFIMNEKSLSDIPSFLRKSMVNLSESTENLFSPQETIRKIINVMDQ